MKSEERQQISERASARHYSLPPPPRAYRPNEQWRMLAEAENRSAADENSNRDDSYVVPLFLYYSTVFCYFPVQLSLRQFTTEEVHHHHLHLCYGMEGTRLYLLFETLHTK